MAEIRRGRPRSESTRRAILEATRDLIAETGYEAMTIEGIAARAGAGKQTIYRWWPSKSVIVADAVLEGYLRLPALQLPETASLHSDLRAWLTAMNSTMNDEKSVSVVRALASAASENQQEAAQLFDRISGPAHETLIGRMRRGQADGQLSKSVDAEAVADALIGAILFRVLAGLPASDRLGALIDVLLVQHPTQPR